MLKERRCRDDAAGWCCRDGAAGTVQHGAAGTAWQGRRGRDGVADTKRLMCGLLGGGAVYVMRSGADRSLREAWTGTACTLRASRAASLRA